MKLHDHLLTGKLANRFWDLTSGTLVLPLVAEQLSICFIIVNRASFYNLYPCKILPL